MALLDNILIKTLYIMDCRYCGEELPRSLESGGIHPGCVAKEEEGLISPLASSEEIKATDNNLIYEKSAIGYISFISLFSWICVGVAFFLFFLSITGGVELNSWFLFAIFIASAIGAISLSFGFQIFFYLKGIYEELKKLNSK